MLCCLLAGILRSTILSALAPHRLALGPGPVSLSLSSLSPLTQQSIAAVAAAQAAVAAAADSAAAAGEQLTPAAAAAIVAGYDEVPFMAKTASMQASAINRTPAAKLVPSHGPMLLAQIGQVALVHGDKLRAPAWWLFRLQVHAACVNACCCAW